MRKIVIKIFGSFRSPSSLYLNLSRAHTLDQKFQLFMQLQQFCSTYSTHLLSLSKNMVKSAGNVVTPQELNTVCGESNEINGEKNCFDFYL